MPNITKYYVLFLFWYGLPVCPVTLSLFVTLSITVTCGWRPQGVHFGVVVVAVHFCWGTCSCSLGVSWQHLCVVVTTQWCLLCGGCCAPQLCWSHVAVFGVCVTTVGVFRARAGNLQGPYCFCSDNVLVQNDCIFHCLNISQNSPRSRLLKNLLIYWHCDFPPVGRVIIEESAFWLLTPILYRTFKNLTSMRALNCVESCDIGHTHFGLPFLFFFSQIREMLQTYFFELLPGNFTDLHETLHSAFVDPPDKTLLKEF